MNDLPKRSTEGEAITHKLLCVVVQFWFWLMSFHQYNFPLSFFFQVVEIDNSRHKPPPPPPKENKH